MVKFLSETCQSFVGFSVCTDYYMSSWLVWCWWWWFWASVCCVCTIAAIA